MNDGLIMGHQFQFELEGKMRHALISFDALRDCFGGAGRPHAATYAENAGEINRKAAEISRRNEHRNPLLLVTADFKKPDA